MAAGADTMGAIVTARARQQPDRIVVRFPDSDVTYGALDERSNRIAHALLDSGLRPGDRAAVMLPNGAAFAHTWVAMAKAGIVEVPVSTALKGDLLAYVLNQAGCRLLVVDARWLDRVTAVAGRLQHVRDVWVVGGDGDAGGFAVRALEEVTAAAPDTPVDVRVTPTDASVILYTSGTTGPSKGVVLSHAANFRLARTLSDAAGLRTGDVLITPFPLFHVAARYVSVLGAMLINGEVTVNERFSASRFWDTCRERGVTAIHYLGSLLQLLLKQPLGDDDRDHGVRLAYGAGAPLPVWKAFVGRFGVPLYELYGMTETGAVTMNRDGAYRVGSCGTVLPDCEVEIHDPDDLPVPVGEVGEIVVRPLRPNVMVERYHDMPEATLRAFRNLWFHCGDLGRFDADGYLYFVGRTKDSIRRRGENISAFEVETAVAGHPAVLEAAVVGVADDVNGEDVLAAVVLQPGASLEPTKLLDHCQEHLPHYAVPRYVRIVTTLPKTPSERVEKYKLQADAHSADTWDRQQHGYEVRR